MAIFAARYRSILLNGFVYCLILPLREKLKQYGHGHLFQLLSKPQPNLNTMVGFDMKMTLQTPPTHPTTETFQALQDELES